MKQLKARFELRDHHKLYCMYHTVSLINNIVEKVFITVFVKKKKWSSLIKEKNRKINQSTFWSVLIKSKNLHSYSTDTVSYLLCIYFVLKKVIGLAKKAVREKTPVAVFFN